MAKSRDKVQQLHSHYFQDVSGQRISKPILMQKHKKKVECLGFGVLGVGGVWVWNKFIEREKLNSLYPINSIHDNGLGLKLK